MASALGPGFEWFVAWRHLRDPERRSRRLLYIGLGLLVLSIAAVVAARFVGPGQATSDVFFQSREAEIARYLQMGGIIGIIAGAVVSYLGILFASFTVFTAISIFGVFLGTAAPIVALSVMSGFEADLKGKIRGAKADVVIARLHDSPFTDWRRARQAIADIPGLVASTPYLETEVMIKAGQTPAGIVLRGIDPETAAGVLDVGRTLRGGRLDDLDHPERVKPALPDPSFDEEAGEDQPAPTALPTILLGEELYARTLRVFIGSEVDVVCPLCKMSPTGPVMGLRAFRVAGHFYSGMYEYDSKLAYVALAEAQRFLGMPDEVTGIDVRTRTPEDARRVAEEIQTRLGAGYEVRTWEDLNKGLFMALKLEKIAMFVVLAFIALVASFSIVSNLIMLVTDKAREVAILKSMGAGNGAILRIFVAEGLYIGLLGLTVGVASGVLGCFLLERFRLPLPTDVYYIDKLPVVMRADEIGAVAALALVLCCLATVYPAVLASRLQPVAGLRYE